MQGATWEDMIAAAQHYGMRATLVCPSTIQQVKEWTDQGDPVVVAWNPEGREWSHASVVFDVSDNLEVSVADPNIPDPDETVRIVSKADFYSKWSEKWPRYLVRRPAMRISLEITESGRQVRASHKELPVDTLRRKTIRLAYKNPDLREHLLPILRRTSARMPHVTPWHTWVNRVVDIIDRKFAIEQDPYFDRRTGNASISTAEGVDIEIQSPVDQGDPLVFEVSSLERSLGTKRVPEMDDKSFARVLMKEIGRALR
jgi:hypothetical protein